VSLSTRVAISRYLSSRINREEIRAYVRFVLAKEFGISSLPMLEYIIEKESNYNPYAINASSGACSLGQFLPCSKIKCDLRDMDCQTSSFINYIRQRYQTPQRAYSFWLSNNYY